MLVSVFVTGMAGAKILEWENRYLGCRVSPALERCQHTQSSFLQPQQTIKQLDFDPSKKPPLQARKTGVVVIDSILCPQTLSINPSQRRSLLPVSSRALDNPILLTTSSTTSSHSSLPRGPATDHYQLQQSYLILS